MAIQTRTITATISEPDGTPLESARVIITLKGLGNGANGAVAPMSIEQVTDEEGIATFTLWENDALNSDTYYEITSVHPTLGTPIHKREVFVVGDSDADVKDLINVAAVSIDPNAALLAQVASDRAAASTAATAAATSASEADDSATSAAGSASSANTSATSAAGSASSASSSASSAGTSASNASTSETNAGNSATSAANSATSSASSASSASSSAASAQAAQTAAETAQGEAEAARDAALETSTAFPSIFNQFFEVVQGDTNVIELGPDQTVSLEDITYQVLGSSNASVSDNDLTYSNSGIGQEILTIVAEDESSNQTQVLVIFNSVDSGSVTEYTLPGVTVS